MHSDLNSVDFVCNWYRSSNSMNCWVILLWEYQYEMFILQQAHWTMISLMRVFEGVLLSWNSLCLNGGRLRCWRCKIATYKLLLAVGDLVMYDARWLSCSSFSGLPLALQAHTCTLILLNWHFLVSSPNSFQLE